MFEYGSPQWIDYMRDGLRSLIRAGRVIRSPRVPQLVDELGEFDRRWGVEEMLPEDMAWLVGLDVRELV